MAALPKTFYSEEVIVRKKHCAGVVVMLYLVKGTVVVGVFPENQWTDGMLLRLGFRKMKNTRSLIVYIVAPNIFQK